MGGSKGKKRVKRVKQFEREFKVNHRLTWCFRVCKSLNIDDPLTWMNKADPDGALLDAWIAFEMHEMQRESDSASGQKRYDDMDTLRAVANAKGRAALKRSSKTGESNG